MSILLKGLRKSFPINGGRLEALESLDLEIEKGEFVCFIGPSGCGKTTLLNIIAGLERPDLDDSVIVSGWPVIKPGPDRVVIFQEDALFPWLTVLQNVEFGLRNKKFPAGKIRPLSLEFLRMVHLEKFRDSAIHALSGGMKQRVALARGLVLNPEILLMDEPFSSLDAQTREKLQLLLQTLWMMIKKTVVFVTHNINEAVFLADRVVVMTARPGRIKKEIRVSLPRPRRIDDHHLLDLARQVRRELDLEIEKTAREEARV